MHIVSVSLLHLSFAESPELTAETSYVETIVDYSRVLVLRAGKVIEFDEPLRLLDKQDGTFREMCEATGSFDELYEKAKKR